LKVLYGWPRGRSGFIGTLKCNDHFTGGFFRPGTKFLRLRPEKAPQDCTVKQVRRENRSALALL
jgi:hypothetical protein